MSFFNVPGPSLKQILKQQQASDPHPSLAQNAGVDKPDKALCVARHVTRMVTSHIPVMNVFNQE